MDYDEEDYDEEDLWWDATAPDWEENEPYEDDLDEYECYLCKDVLDPDLDEMFFSVWGQICCAECADLNEDVANAVANGAHFQPSVGMVIW